MNCGSALEHLAEFVTAVGQAHTTPPSPEAAKRVFTGLVRGGPVLAGLNELMNTRLSFRDWRAMTVRAAGHHLSANGMDSVPSQGGLDLVPSPTTDLGRRLGRVARRGITPRYDPLATLERDAHALFDNDRLTLFPSTKAIEGLQWTEAEEHELAHGDLELQMRNGVVSPYHLWIDTWNGEPLAPGASDRVTAQEILAYPKAMWFLSAKIRAHLKAGGNASDPEIAEYVEALAKMADVTAYRTIADCARKAREMLQRGQNPSLSIQFGESPDTGAWVHFRAGNTRIRFPVLSPEMRALRERYETIADPDSPAMVFLDYDIRAAVGKRLAETETLATLVSAGATSVDTLARGFAECGDKEARLRAIQSAVQNVYGLARDRRYTPVP